MKRILAKPYLVALLLAGLCLGLVYGGHRLILFVEQAADLQALAADAMLAHPALFAILVVYVLLLAVPFVPGAELGFFLLLVFGAQIAPIVYLATVLALTLSFSIGALIPPHRLLAAVRALGWTRTADILSRHTVAPDPEDPPSVTDTNRWIKRALKHRYVGLGLLLNTPGNTVLGGGGGIAMAAGLSRVFRPGAFVLTVMVAVAPVPALYLVAMP